jgi:hypothetical protein
MNLLKERQKVIHAVLVYAELVRQKICTFFSLYWCILGQEYCTPQERISTDGHAALGGAQQICLLCRRLSPVLARHALHTIGTLALLLSNLSSFYRIRTVFQRMFITTLDLLERTSLYLAGGLPWSTMARG